MQAYHAQQIWLTSTHDDVLNVFPSSLNIYKVSFALKFETYIVHIHVYVLAVFFIAAFDGALPPPVGQWNSVKPLAGLCIASPVSACMSSRSCAPLSLTQVYSSDSL